MRGRGRKVTEFTAQQVPHPLNELEQRAKAAELAGLCQEIDTLRANAAEHASTERKSIRALEKRRRVLAECVRTGTEMRDAQLDIPGTKGIRGEAAKMARVGGVDA